MLYSLLNSGLRNFIEDNAAVRIWIQPQNKGQMPGNGLSFAVGVACQIDFIGILGIFLKCLDEVPLAADIDVFRCEIMLDIDAELTFRQIAQMSHRSAHHVFSSQIFFDGLGLSWRLNND